jgi:hypothetical protein
MAVISDLAGLRFAGPAIAGLLVFREGVVVRGLAGLMG